MPDRRKKTVDIRELVLQMRQLSSDRAVQRATGMHRQTVKRYRIWATEQGLLTEAPLPPLAALQTLVEATLAEPKPPQNMSSVEPYRATVQQLRQEGVEMAAIFQRLLEGGYGGSYSAVRRFVHSLEPAVKPEVMVRVERRPGEEAQVDFGYAGLMLDPAMGQLRRAWAFVMTLAWSRHQYVEFVFDQTIATWLLCHRHALEFFGGAPERIVPDNLKAAVVRACFDDPLIQQTYRECAEHYGFLIAPCRVATPQHKGKVEQGGVHFVKRNFLGGRQPGPIAQANQDVRVWCHTTAGLRTHGTTREQPWARFDATERARLKPLPAAPYDLAVWKEVTVSNDGHITFENAYYSVPLRFKQGDKLWVRGGTQTVNISTPDHQWAATHDRAAHPGERLTHPAHLPPEKVAGLLVSREGCRAAAADIGPATSQVVTELLADPVVDRLHTAKRLLGLRARFGDAHLEAACAKALQFAEPAYVTIKRILVSGLAVEPVPATAVPATPARTFARTAAELLGHLFGAGAHQPGADGEEVPGWN
jgi:transposase